VGYRGPGDCAEGRAASRAAAARLAGGGAELDDEGLLERITEKAARGLTRPRSRSAPKSHFASTSVT